MQGPSRWDSRKEEQSFKPALRSELDLHPQPLAHSSWAPWGWHRLLAPCHPISKAPKGQCPEWACPPGRAPSFTDPLDANGPLEALEPAPPTPPAQAPARNTGALRRPLILASQELSTPQAEPHPLLFHEHIARTLNRQRDLGSHAGASEKRGGSRGLTDGPCGLTVLTAQKKAAR